MIEQTAHFLWNNPLIGISVALVIIVGQLLFKIWLSRNGGKDEPT